LASTSDALPPSLDPADAHAAELGATDASMASAPLGDVAAGDGAAEPEPSPEQAFDGAGQELLPAELDPRAGERLLALLEIGERHALRRAGVEAPSPLWHPDERMILELLAPSAAQAFAGVEPPPPKLALALLFGFVALHAGLLVSAHRREEHAARKNDDRQWGPARDAAAEAARSNGPGDVGFPPAFRPKGR
jgi:hypothetical protein